MAKRVEVDISAIGELQKNLHLGKVMSLGRLGHFGRQALQTEIPRRTGNMATKGVSSPDVDEKAGTVELTVSASRDSVGARLATVHYPSGKTKQISLRPQVGFNYAETVARGRPAIQPKVGRALIIPVDTVRAGEGYISSGTQLFVVRRSAGPQAPNPFDERAAKRIEDRGPAIVGEVFSELFT